MRMLRACPRNAAAIFLAASCGLGVAAIAAPAAEAAASTVVYGFGGKCPPTNWTHPAVRPTHAWFNLACEDGVKQIKWQDWRRSSATGHGLHLRFTGFGFIPQKATITLSAVRTHRGHRYFSHMVIRWKTKNGKHHKEVLNWRRDTGGAGWIWVYA